MAFVEAFAELKSYSIVWKFDEALPEVAPYPHIKVVNWIPQRDLLGETH
jgi:UDP-glucoronosyl and UDP-glucosyl transferase